MKVNDSIIGLIALFFGGAVVLYARSFPTLAGMPVGPDLFPSLIGSAMMICGLVMIGRSLAARRRGDGPPLLILAGWATEKRALLRASAVLAALLFYNFASQPLGFHITGSILVTVLMIAFGVPALQALPAALVAVFLIHYIFYGLLRVSLPWGLLLPYAW